MSASRLVTVLLLAVLGTGWFVLFRPAVLGGNARYIKVAGDSMEPTIDGGDLVIVRKRNSYEIGEVIAYRVAQGIVIHRIIGGDPTAGFVTQGDNRPKTDAWRPRPADVVGRHALRVPRLGTAVHIVQRPAVLAIAILAATLFVAGGAHERRRGRRQAMHTPRRRIFISLTAAMAAAVVAGMGLTSPAHAPAPLQASALDDGVEDQSQRIEFSYRARTRPSALDPLGGETIGAPETVQTDKPVSVLISVAESLELQIAYTFAPADATVSGTLGYVLAVTARDGWERTWPLADPISFEGPSVKTKTLIQLGDIAARLDQIEKDTGFRPVGYDVAVVVTARVSGVSRSGQPLDDTFGAPFTMRWSGKRIVLDSTLVHEGSKQPITVAIEAEGSSPFNLPAFAGAIRSPEALGIAAMVVLAGLAGLAWFLLRDETRILKLRLGTDIIQASLASDRPAVHQVNVVSLRALAGVARAACVPLCRDRSGRAYFALDRQVLYIWLEPSAPGTADPTRHSEH